MSLSLFDHLPSFYPRYWGKRDTKLILPTNSSLSVTLDQDHLRSTTTSRADPSFDKDRLWLNGKEESIEAGGRLSTCISEMKRLRAAVEARDPHAPKVSAQLPFRFPTVPSHPISLASVL
jgi:diphosphomevalonate decarboxylase